MIAATAVTHRRALWPEERAPVVHLIGNTPLLRVRLFEEEFPEVELYGKAEWFNPGGSVKDRPALYMVRDGIRRGLLTPEKVLLDSTSGNTGIAYAMLGAALGFRVKLCLPESASPERRRMLLSYGAETVYTSAMEGSDGAQRAARAIYEADPNLYFLPCQYDNPANTQAHFETTAPEIFEQTRGRVTHLVAGLGTTGTLVGTGRGLKARKPDVRVVAVEPESPLHGLEGLKHIPTSIRPQIYDESVEDEKVRVRTEDAYAMAERLAREEGIFIGHSAGAALVAAGKVAAEVGRGVIVVIFPDGGDRYLGEPLHSDRSDQRGRPGQARS